MKQNYAGGYDIYNNDNDPKDDNGNGTHCAGIVAAVDNTEGVIGVAPKVELYAVKVLSGSGSGSLSTVADSRVGTYSVTITASSNNDASKTDSASVTTTITEKTVNKIHVASIEMKKSSFMRFVKASATVAVVDQDGVLSKARQSQASGAVSRAIQTAS